jgi:hypothetical protein
MGGSVRVLRAAAKRGSDGASPSRCESAFPIVNVQLAGGGDLANNRLA